MPTFASGREVSSQVVRDTGKLSWGGANATTGLDGRPVCYEERASPPELLAPPGLNTLPESVFETGFDVD